VAIYGIVLFFHIVGALGLFAGIGLEQVSLARLRDVETMTQARDWLGVLTNLRRGDAPSGLVILASGIYMMVARWGHEAWIGLALIGMVLMAVLGIAVTSRRARALKEAVAGTDGPITSALRLRLADRILRVSATLRAAIAIGIVFNMAVKPAPFGALVTMFVALGAGALVGFAQWYGRGAALGSSRSGALSGSSQR
jgi:hypothetical protein